MSERAKIPAKTPEAKRKHTISRKQKTTHSQSRSSPVNRILFLQQTVGNQAVRRMMKSGAIQTKLRNSISCPVSPRRCPFGGACHTCPARIQAKVVDGVQVQRQEEEPEEEEEEPIQTKLVGGGQVQRQEEEPEEEEEEPIQTKQSNGQMPHGSRGVEAQIHSMKGGGQPLPASVRAFFETRFGYDFSQVRIHTGARAGESARAVNARAFTRGQHVVFGAGQYAPETGRGQRLLAHELTHVVQQDRSLNRNNTVRNSTNGNMTNPMLANQVLKSSLIIRRWGYGAGTGPLPHYVEVPPRERSRVNAARRIVERVVNNPRDYPRCHRAFQNECPSPSANELLDRFNALTVWRRSSQNATYYYGGSVAPDHMAYTERCWRWGRWMLANTMIHEMVHRCGFHNENRINRIAEICGMPSKPT